MEKLENEELRWQETLEALKVADDGDIVPSEEVFNWLDTWGCEPDLTEKNREN